MRRKQKEAGWGGPCYIFTIWALSPGFLKVVAEGWFLYYIPPSKPTLLEKLQQAQNTVHENNQQAPPATGKMGLVLTRSLPIPQKHTAPEEKPEARPGGWENRGRPGWGVRGHSHGRGQLCFRSVLVKAKSLWNFSSCILGYLASKTKDLFFPLLLLGFVFCRQRWHMQVWRLLTPGQVPPPTPQSLGKEKIGS